MSFVVIGSSGFLGEQLSSMLSGHSPVLTHYTKQKFEDSIKYNFFEDSIFFLPDTPSTIIFTSAVELHENTFELREAMQRFVNQLKPHRFIYLSSDGIFNGRQGHYREDDTPQPQTLYGRNLLVCESLIRETLSNYCIIRPSYIYGWVNGKLDDRLNNVRERLVSGEKVYGFRNMYKSPLGVRQLAQAIIRVVMSEFIGTIHVAGERVSVYDFYHQAMTTLGVNTDNLKADSMPDSAEFLKDTSLSIAKWTKLSDFKALSIADTLTTR